MTITGSSTGTGRWHETLLGVISHSAGVAASRPFYDRHADAYDALITDPVAPWVTAVAQRLRAAGLTGADVLDAGCGTGRHAAALIEHGHRLTLLDASTALLDVARKRCPDAPIVTADVCYPTLSGPFDAVISRGVLNDLLTDQERDAVLLAFARLTRSAGLLVLDVRDAAMSRQRADGTWRTATAVLPDGASLRFMSRPTWKDGRIIVEERYELRDLGHEEPVISDYLFEMRPWTRDELSQRLTSAGYRHINVQAGVGRRTPDRIFVTAMK